MMKQDNFTADIKTSGYCSCTNIQTHSNKNLHSPLFYSAAVAMKRDIVSNHVKSPPQPVSQCEAHMFPVFCLCALHRYYKQLSLEYNDLGIYFLHFHSAFVDVNVILDFFAITDKVHLSILLLRVGVVATNHGKASSILVIQVRLYSIISYHCNCQCRCIFCIQSFVLRSENKVVCSVNTYHSQSFSH